MDLTLLEELSEVLSKFSGAKCTVMQLEDIFKFVLQLEIEKGPPFVQIFKDRIFSVIKEQGSIISLEHVNTLASSLFLNDLNRKCKFLELFSNDLNEKSFNPDEFEEIDIDLDTSEETFHTQDCHVLEDSSASLYGTVKCPCGCHSEQHSIHHCFICAIQFVQGCTYTSTNKGMVVHGSKTTSDSSSGS